MRTLKLITLNIEGDKHLGDVENFLSEQKADIVCLQEVFAADVARLEVAAAGRATFAPMQVVDVENQYNIAPRGEWGLAMITPHDHLPVMSYYYRGRPDVLPSFSDPLSANRMLQATAIDFGKEKFTIAHTHFTWSAQGKASDEQKQDLIKLKEILNGFEDLILCGDFNAPRGEDIYLSLSAPYQDALPPEVTTTIDSDRHYAGALELVVDHVFYTPLYQLRNIQVHSGVSDHMAIVAEFEYAAVDNEIEE